MDKYVQERELGKGGFGRAILAKRKADGSYVVIKETLSQGPDALADARKEAELLQKMHHPYIVRCYETFEERGNFYIVTEFATGDPGDLHKVWEKAGGKLPEAYVVKILKMLCSALAHVHRRHVVHRDIKPANIFLMKDGSVKLGDFGIGRAVSATRAFHQTVNGAGTIAFMSPELLGLDTFNSAADIWAVGITCYLLLSGTLPFKTGVELAMQPPPPLGSSVSKPLASLINAMLEKDPDRRPTAMAIQAWPQLGPSKVVCWRDPKVRNLENDKIVRDEQARCAGKLELIAAENDADALEVIQAVGPAAQIWVITNRGDEGEAFVQKVRRAGVKTEMLMFCGNTTGLGAMPGVRVDTSGRAVPKYLDEVVIPAVATSSSRGGR